MPSSGDERLPWEYAGGPVVGRDAPVTSEPRDEQAQGVPASRAGEDDNGGRAGTEVREVRAEDPALSSRVNERLTDELHDVLGAERMRVPADRPRATRGEHPRQHGLAAFLNMHRFQLVRATMIALTFGAVIALITGDWWVLPLAAGVHALGTMTVVLTAIRMTTTTERPSAELAAAMAEEGVPNPDEHFSRMVEEFTPEPEHGTSEVISPGYNERRTDALTQPADAAQEQSSAMTPTSQPSEPAGHGGAPDLIIWTTALSLLIISIVIPAAMGGGWLWLLTAVMVPLLAGWVTLQRLLITHNEHTQARGRGPLVAIVLCTAAAVTGFCAVVALAFQH